MNVNANDNKQQVLSERESSLSTSKADNQDSIKKHRKSNSKKFYKENLKKTDASIQSDNVQYTDISNQSHNDKPDNDIFTNKTNTISAENNKSYLSNTKSGIRISLSDPLNNNTKIIQNSSPKIHDTSDTPHSDTVVSFKGSSDKKSSEKNIIHTDKQHIDLQKNHSLLSDKSSTENIQSKTKQKSNSKAFYKNQKSSEDNTVCHGDTPNSNSYATRTTEALEYLKSEAQAEYDNIISQIEDFDNKYNSETLPLIHQRETDTIREVSRIRLERAFEEVTDPDTGEINKVIRYKPVRVTELIPESQAKSHYYKHLSHKQGSSSISALIQESSQAMRIAAKKGLIHSAFAVSEKIEIPTALESNKPFSLLGTSVKNTLLAGETLAVKSSEIATDKALHKLRNEIDRSGEENDGYKTARLTVNIASDIISDIKTIKEYDTEKKEKEAKRELDFEKNQHDRINENLEYQKQKAENKVNVTKDRLGQDNTNSELHTEKHIELSDKTRIELADKSIVKPNSEKTRADTKFVDDTTGHSAYKSKSDKVSAKKGKFKQSSEPHHGEHIDLSDKSKIKHNTTKNRIDNTIGNSAFIKEHDKVYTQKDLSEPSSELHTNEHIELSDKSRIELSDKTTITPNLQKSRTETKIVDDITNELKPTPNKSIIEKDLEKIQRRKAVKKAEHSPHKYVAKFTNESDESGNKRVRIKIERKDLSVNEKKLGISDVVTNSSSLKNEINAIRSGEIELFGTHKDPTLTKTISDKVQTRAISKAGTALRQKAERDASDSNGFEAAEKTTSLLYSTGKTYDKAKSMLQPAANKVGDMLITAEERIYRLSYEAQCQRQSMLQPKNESKSKRKSDKQKKRRYEKNRRKNFISFKDAETKKNFINETVVKKAKETGKSFVGIVAAAVFIFIVFPIILLGGTSGTSTSTAIFSMMISPTEDLDLTQSEQYWTELAENLIKEYRNYPNTHTGYDKYKANTSITKLIHDPYKLLAYLSVACKNEKGVWDYETAKPYIETIFNEQYELYSKETTEIRKNVTTETKTEYNTSFWIPDEYSIYNTPVGNFNSSDYNSYADLYCSGAGERTILITTWNKNATVYDVGTNNGEKYENAQTVNYSNEYRLYIEYNIQDGGVWGIWKLEYEYQTWYDEEYKTLEYGIKQKKDFDTIITELSSVFDDEQEEFYGYYNDFKLGHQTFSAPVNPFNVIKYAGYNTDVNQSDGLNNSITVSAALGQDITCPCNGTITKAGENSISIYYPTNHSTVYIDNIVPAVTGTVQKKAVIGKASSNEIVITVIDEDGNYQNPYLLIDWS